MNIYLVTLHLPAVEHTWQGGQMIVTNDKGEVILKEVDPLEVRNISDPRDFIEDHLICTLPAYLSRKMHGSSVITSATNGSGASVHLFRVDFDS